MAAKKKVTATVKPVFKSKAEEIKACEARYSEMKRQRRLSRAQEDKLAADNHAIVIAGISQAWSYAARGPQAPQIQLIKGDTPVTLTKVDTGEVLDVLAEPTDTLVAEMNQ